MTNTHLKAAVDALFSANKDLGDAFLGGEAIITLYTRIEDWALQAQAQIIECSGQSVYVATDMVQPVWELLFQIQQVINLPPLDHFLKALSQDEHLAIRVAAKGNLTERIGGYPMDREMSLMAQANLRVMSMTDQLIENISFDPDIFQGFTEWRDAEINPDFPYDYK